MDPEVDTVSVEEPEPPMEVGANVAVAPEGTPLALRFTVPVKQVVAVTLAV